VRLSGASGKRRRSPLGRQWGLALFCEDIGGQTASGDLYFADTFNNAIREASSQEYQGKTQNMSVVRGIARTATPRVELPSTSRIARVTPVHSIPLGICAKTGYHDASVHHITVDAPGQCMQASLVHLSVMS
jgi:hypothetical protein